jgi:hypothetical protein
LHHQVLRYFGWFKEIITERREEKWRVRKCVIYYYLEDGTIHISEPRVDNSGIPQGTFLKRMQVPKEDGTFLKYSDLLVGETLQIYQRDFNIISCDDFTRKFLAGKGITLGEDGECPEDPYTILKQKQKDHFTRQQRKPDQTSQTFFSRGALSKKMLMNDRKVLRFYCVWEESSSFGSVRRQSILHYYLSDDTIEVLEQSERNSGRDSFPLLLRRMKLTKGEKHVPSDFFRDPKEEKYLNFMDLKIGEKICVYEKDLLLYDCDAFTREFYNQKLRVPLENLQPIDVFKEDKVVYVQPKEVKHAFSIGNDEEALMAAKSLVLKPPKKDMKKFVLNDGKLLRYVCKLTDTPEAPLKSRYDAEREFVVTYYLVDDTILIFEPPQRNSGIVGGKFLERQKVKSPKNKLYKETDLTVGNYFIVYGRAFLVTSADEYTLRHMEENSDKFPESDVNAITAKLKEVASGGALDELKSLLINSDYEGAGFTSKQTLIDVVSKIGGSLSEQEALTICRSLNNNSSDVVDTAAFLDSIA